MLAAAQRAEAKRALLEERARARKDAAKRAKDVVAGEKEEFLEKLREARVASALEEEIRTHEVDGAARSALVVGSGMKLRTPLPLSLRSTGCALSSRRRTRRWKGGSRRCVCVRILTAPPRDAPRDAPFLGASEAEPAPLSRSLPLPGAAAARRPAEAARRRAESGAARAAALAGL